MKKNLEDSSGAVTKSGWKTVISIILIIYSLITVFLVGETIASSFKTKIELVDNLIGLPKEPTLANYFTVFVKEGFGRYIMNSISLVAISLILLIIVSSMLAYGMAQYTFKGKKFLQAYFLIGLMMPVQLSILPLYLMLSRLKMTNSFLGLALLYAANLSFSFLVFNQFFLQLPQAMIESAHMDGASDMCIFWKIVVPISKPVFSTVGLLQFVTIWNDFFLPMVFLPKKNAHTLTLAIYSYTGNFLKNWDKIFAAATIALVPILIIYFLFSEQIVAGLTAGSTKE
ncbi:carbohydrate ABC transporter permease [Catonella massiliensis]|uniref:Carbohydrate ABC transporter permease n=1 Tax=Catonella massiliensis TaxID=2799636 RepID=A0ABS1J3T9_9FIRM|nr:carbohydrate ABC transporter permease [Catonella massiliensis]MBK5898559.1 carbohydrate ABC transporter permease [Catonella massiliensis]